MTRKRGSAGSQGNHDGLTKRGRPPLDPSTGLRVSGPTRPLDSWLGARHRRILPWRTFGSQFFDRIGGRDDDYAKGS